MIPEAGQRFGPYEILGRVGSGAMGLVFRAWDARLHREVAIKLLHEDYEMPGMRERFLQEARAASALNHPNICTVFDLGEQDGEPYMVMELLEGETLKEKISRGAVPVEEIALYSQQVAEALGAAHAKGIVHRDIKPANIFLVDQPNGTKQAKVLDFGLAKIGLATRGGRASRALDLTLAGATVGTLSYMSPEQARGQNLDERSDLFSLGVVMYEMATRQVPFQGATSALIFVQLLNHPPEPLHDWNASIPKELEKVVLKLLSKERSARYQTANELAEALRKLSFRSGGGWLKRAAAAVPLVRASDPVARGKRPVRATSDSNRTIDLAVSPSDARAVTANMTRQESSAENVLIRPVVRAPYLESGRRDEGVLRGGDRTVSSAKVVPKEIGESSNASKAEVFAPFPLESGSADATSGPDGIDDRSSARTEPVMSEHEIYSLARFKEEDIAFSKGLHNRVIDQKKETKALNTRSVMVTAGVLGALMIVGLFILNTGQFRQAVLQQGDPLLLTVIQNRTNDKTLDGVVIEGLELSLGQGEHLTLRGQETYRAGLRQIEAEGSTVGTVASRRVAQAVGAKAYLYGEISGTGSPYSISVDVLSTGSNDKLTSIREVANGKEELAAAIDRVAHRVRADMGEKDRTIAKFDKPLQDVATANLDSLRAYSAGETAQSNGRIELAISYFEEAKRADPKFAQAHLRLAWLYRSERAEVRAAEEAKLALDNADPGNNRLRLLAQLCYEMNASGDLTRAAGVLKQFRELYPMDIAGTLVQARLLLAQGDFSGALQAAQQAYDRDPYNADAYAEAQRAMIGLDRSLDALQLQARAQKLGVLPGVSMLAAAYLAGGTEASSIQEPVASTLLFKGTQGDASSLMDYGLSLDNDGRVADGAIFWQTAAASTETASSAAFLLAQAGLDRALMNDCNAGMDFAKKSESKSPGTVAQFNLGMIAALCGNRADSEKVIEGLKLQFPHSTAVTGNFVADLQAAQALSERDPKAALGALPDAAPYDQVSLTAYLRGLAHLENDESALAVADFQSIVDHRGAAFLAGSSVYPMAQIGLARAYAAIGDEANSRRMYQRFADSWQHADRGLALLAEAHHRTL